MTSYTVKKVRNACQAINVDTNQVVCNDGDKVVVGGKTYTAAKRPSDQVCCIYQIVEGVGGDRNSFVQVLSRGTNCLKSNKLTLLGSSRTVSLLLAM